MLWSAKLARSFEKTIAIVIRNLVKNYTCSFLSRQRSDIMSTSGFTRHKYPLQTSLESVGVKEYRETEEHIPLDVLAIWVVIVLLQPQFFYVWLLVTENCGVYQYNVAKFLLMVFILPQKNKHQQFLIWKFRTRLPFSHFGQFLVQL